MNDLTTYEEILKYYNKLLLLCINSIGYYSEFISNTMNRNWQIYTNKNNNLKKRNNSFEKIEKNINKLQDKVYGDIGNLRKILNEIDEVIKEIDQKELLNKKEIKKIYQNIDKCVNERDILTYLLSLYIDNDNKRNKLLNKEKKKNNEPLEKDNIPVIKRTYCDKNGYWYANISIKNNNIQIDKKRFEKEVLLYNKCLNKKENLSFIEYDINKKKISPYEKRRRNYIRSMFELDKKILELKNKKVDMIYPLDKLYNCVQEIVDNLYKELFDFKNEEDIFDSLRTLTIKTYGSERKLKLYDEIVSYFEESLKNENVLLKDELYNYSITLKNEKDYKCFNIVEGVIPTRNNIYDLLSEIIIRKLNINYDFYKQNISKNIKRTCQYMNVNDLVRFYTEFKTILLSKRINNADKLNNLYIDLQKTICEMISLKNNLNVKAIPKMYLQENIYF